MNSKLFIESVIYLPEGIEDVREEIYSYVNSDFKSSLDDEECFWLGTTL